MAEAGGKFYTVLEDRGLLSVTGPDARAFLQGLVSNDMDKVTPGRAIYAALLTPQGKFLHDFFIAELTGALIIDCEGPRLDDLRQRLGRYKLRAQMEIADITGEFAVVALLGAEPTDAESLHGQEGRGGPFDVGVCYVDPRYAGIGARAILPRHRVAEVFKHAGFAEAPASDYDRLRLGYGLPDGSHDMVVEKALLLENGFEELNGVDWDKGCYVGQELTARLHYRGLVNKRLVPVTVDGPLPEAGTKVMFDGKQAGEMRSGRGGLGLAVLRLEMVAKAAKHDTPFTAEGAKLTPFYPAWMGDLAAAGDTEAGPEA